MGKLKASSKQILHVMDTLIEAREQSWSNRFGPDLAVFRGLRRAEIQQGLQSQKGIQYSAGGMRGRLKSMVKDGRLEKMRFGERTVYYFKP